MAEEWHDSIEVWDLHFCCNLTDFELLAWTSLTAILASVHFRMVPNSWNWTIDSSTSFTVKSLIDDLTCLIGSSTIYLYFIIWSGYYLKKIKLLF